MNENNENFLFEGKKLYKARYKTEHDIIPRLFYEDAERFIIGMILDRNLIFKIYGRNFELDNVENPYGKSDFVLSVNLGKHNTSIVCVELPEPPNIPLCKRIYFAFNNDYSQTMYFTSEKSLENTYLCGWSQNRNHLNFGSIGGLSFLSDEENAEDADGKKAELERVTEIFDKMCSGKD